MILFSAALAAAIAFMPRPVFAAPDPAGTSLLAGLANPKTFTVGRESSYDPSGGNADGRHDIPTQPGETRTIADIKGPGPNLRGRPLPAIWNRVFRSLKTVSLLFAQMARTNQRR